MNARKFRAWQRDHAPIDYGRDFIIGWAGMLTIYLPKLKYVGRAKEVIGHD